MQHYADNIIMKLGESNIDDLNAAKYFELYHGAMDTAKALKYKADATTCRNKLKYEHMRIQAPLRSRRFWHKKQYVNQMCSDGLIWDLHSMLNGRVISVQNWEKRITSNRGMISHFSSTLFFTIPGSCEKAELPRLVGRTA